MSEFVVSEQTRWIMQVFGAYCIPCQERAVVIALAEVRETSPARAFALAGLTLENLEDGVVPGCQQNNNRDGNRCANSKAANTWANSTYSDPDTYHEYGPYAGV